MKIIIIGAGTVGTAICQQLVGEGHDITVVDRSADLLEEIESSLDVATALGNGAEISVLRKAGAKDTDLLIAVTSSDEINILCCTAAKKLGTKNTVARVRNPEYSELMGLMKDEMNLSMTINPEYAAAREIYRILRFPAATKIESFYHGKVELVEYTVADGSNMIGTTLYELNSRLNIKFLVCAVLRDGEAHIPSGNFKIESGDVIYITAPEDAITKFFRAVGAYENPVRDVIVAGGGRVSYYLESLLKNTKIRSVIIDSDKERCRSLAETYQATVIHGNPTKQSLLLEEGIERADAFAALTDSDEENAIVSMYAKSVSGGKIITMINTVSYAELFKNVGLDRIISPKSATASYILRYVRSIQNAGDSKMETLHKLMDGKVEALEFLVNDDIESITSVPLRSLKLKKNVLVACIVRSGEVIIPSGDDSINCGDTVIIVALGGQIKDVKEMLK